MIVVADAGPLLHLHWVGASGWALPPCSIAVVEDVWREVEMHDVGALVDRRLTRVVAETPLHPEVLRLGMDPGETAALSYALAPQRRAEALLLCDEASARRACAALSLPVVGSIGLILEAFRAGRASRDLAAAALLDLPHKGRLHVRAELLQRALDGLAIS